MKKNKSICRVCNKPINGQCLKALDKSYHPDCFTCSTCRCRLGAEFFELDGLPYCAEHSEDE